MVSSVVVKLCAYIPIEWPISACGCFNELYIQCCSSRRPLATLHECTYYTTSRVCHGLNQSMGAISWLTLNSSTSIIPYLSSCRLNSQLQCYPMWSNRSPPRGMGKRTPKPQTPHPYPVNHMLTHAQHSCPPPSL